MQEALGEQRGVLRPEAPAPSTTTGAPGATTTATDRPTDSLGALGTARSQCACEPPYVRVVGQMMVERDGPVIDNGLVSSLTAILDERTLRRLAGKSSFGRGADYFEVGKIRALAEKDGTVVAKVQGTRSYDVKLWVEGKELGYSCSCPAAEDGECCKHCVAVGLAVLAHTPSANKRENQNHSEITVGATRS